MLERLIVVVLLSVAAVLVYQWWVRRQLRTVEQIKDHDPLLEGVQPGLPTIVYFTTPNCIPCRTRQQPALEQLRRDLNDHLQIVKVDATADPDAAKRWGVMTAPTTFILDDAWQPRHVNYGVADVEKLKGQLGVTG